MRQTWNSPWYWLQHSLLGKVWWILCSQEMVQIPRHLSKTRAIINKITKLNGTSSNKSQLFLSQDGAAEIFKHWKSEVLKQPLDAGIGARKQSCLSTSLGKLMIRIIWQRWGDPGFFFFFFLMCCYPSKDAEMKLGHFLLVKLSNRIDIVRVALAGLTKSQKDMFVSLKHNLWSLFAFLWGMAKGCIRKGQVTPGDAGKPLRFLAAWPTPLGGDSQLGSCMAKSHSNELLRCFGLLY